MIDSIVVAEKMLNKWRKVVLKLIIPIRWSFDPKCWNCSNSEKYWLHCLSCGKYRMNYRGAKKSW